MINFDLAAVKKSPMIQNVFWLGLEALAKYKVSIKIDSPQKNCALKLSPPNFETLDTGETTYQILKDLSTFSETSSTKIPKNWDQECGNSRGLGQYFLYKITSRLSRPRAIW